MPVRPIRLFVCALLAASTLSGVCDEILLHSGPTVSTPISSLSSPERTAEELVFVKQFHVDSRLLAKLPPPRSPSATVPVSADHAVELAKKTVDLGGGRPTFSVVKQELLIATVGDAKSVEYYLIEMLVNGSTEHRIVLMDGTIVKPTLKRLGGGKR